MHRVGRRVCNGLCALPQGSATFLDVPQIGSGRSCRRTRSSEGGEWTSSDSQRARDHARVIGSGVSLETQVGQRCGVTGQQGGGTVTDYHRELLRLRRQAMGLGLLPSSARKWRSLDNSEAWHAQASPRKEPRTPRSQRPRCGARTRKGTPCKTRVRHGLTRCRLHGGASTGPRTDDGREAIRASNRRRAIVADLAELVPAMNEIRRRQWAAAILDLAAGGTRATAGEAAGVTAQTIGRWCKVDTFDDTLTRAGQRLRRRQQAAERSVHIESTCIDPWTMPDFDLAELLDADPLEGLDLSIPENLLEDLKLPELEPLALDALLADVGQWVAELPTFELDKLLEGLDPGFDPLPPRR